MKPATFALPLICLPHLAPAAPITLDLTGDEFVQAAANQGLQGFFPSAGFLVTVQSNEDPSAAGEALYDLTKIGDGNTGADNGVNRVVFSPQSGATFDLEAVSIERFYIGLYAEYSARDTAPPPGEEFVGDTIPLLYENTYLRGFKPGGEVVTARFLPYDFGNLEELTPPTSWADRRSPSTTTPSSPRWSSGRASRTSWPWRSAPERASSPPFPHRLSRPNACPTISRG